MITASEAFDRLVEACPSYFDHGDLDGYVALFEDADTPDLFVRSSALAHHLVDLLSAGRDAEVGTTFDEVERLLDDGDDDAVELVVMGLIEPLQNIVSHDDVLVGTERIVALLGPRTTIAWADQADLWTDAATLAHEGPRMDDGDYRSIIDPNLRRYFQAHKRRLADGTLVGASDVVNYQVVTRLRPVGTGKFYPVPWPALVVGIVLAVCMAVAIYR